MDKNKNYQEIKMVEKIMMSKIQERQLLTTIYFILSLKSPKAVKKIFRKHILNG